MHKTSWTVTIRTAGIEIAHFTQPPNPHLLYRYIQQKYPGGKFYSAYEAGFCGTAHHFLLCELGIENIIVNAADIPQTENQKKNKPDLHDSRSIARYLEKGLLSGIYIMSKDQQERRALYRCREAIVKDTSRSINRLRSFLCFFGIETPEAFKGKSNISNSSLTWLSEINLDTEEGNDTLKEYTNDVKYHRNQLLQITQKLRNSIMGYFKDSYTCMLSVPGIGPITAMGL